MIPLDKVETAHGATNVVETDVAVIDVAVIDVAVIDVVETDVAEIKKREMEIGNASPVKIATLPSGPNATDAVATKTVQVAMVPQVGHLERSISEIISELGIAKEAGVLLETEVGETVEAEVPAAHSETDVVVDSTHKVMNRFACIGTKEA